VGEAAIRKRPYLTARRHGRLEGLAWPVISGVKPAASEPGRLACERMVLTCLVYDTGGRSQSLARPEEKLSAGALWPSDAQALAAISSYPRAWVPSPPDLKGDVTAMLVYVPTKTGGRLTRPLESDLHLSPWAIK
jgi:hypothetical protein